MKKSNPYLPLGYLFTACVPFILTFALVQGVLHASMANFLPVYSDEIDYWHETATFIRAGFEGGYYTINELPAKASFTPFGPHGPVIILFWGLIGKVLGWNYASPFLLNLVIITLALAIFFFLTRPGWSQLGWMGAFLLFCWPVLFFLPTGMEETINQAGGILFAALAFRFLRDQTINPWLAGVTLLLLIFFSSIRYTWIMMVPVFAIAAIKQLNWKKGGWIGLVCLGIILAGFYLISAQYSPYPDSFTSSLAYHLKRSLPEGIRFFGAHFQKNLRAFFPPGEIFHWETMVRFQMLLICIYLIFLLVAGRQKTDRRLIWVLLLALIPILVAQILFYEIRRLIDVRIFAPYLLFAVLLILLTHPKKWAWITGAVILGNAMLLPSMLNIYSSYHLDHFFTDPASIESTREQLAPYLQYQENAPHWCNTVTTTLDQKELLGIPAGIGISYVMEARSLVYPLEAKYMLFRNNSIAHSKPVHLKKLAHLDIGILYLNLDAKCP